MSIFSSVFDWFKSRSETNNPVKTQRITPQTRDFTDGMQVNQSLTRGLYFGDYPGLKLASALAMAPVKIPVFFQGFPIPKTEDDNLNEVLQDLIKQFNVQIQQIHIQRRREGTVWVWPKFSQGKLYWEFIPDNTVCDIIRNIDTNEIQELIVEENITITAAYSRNITVTRRRSFTRERITVQYLGDSMLPTELKAGTVRNPIGMLPVPFSCEADGDDIRGHSIYGRIISDLKAYHDIDLSLSTLLAKFKIKLLLGTEDPDAFAQANGFDDAKNMFSDLDISTIDLMIHRPESGDEKPELMSPPLEAYQAFMDALKMKFRKVIEGSGLPEIAWGLKTEGNLASVQENMSTLMMYVRGDQRECTNPWIKVFTASLQLMNIVNMNNTDFELTVEWNDLDSINDETKSIIFKNFAEGINKIMSVAGMTKHQLHRLWNMNFPNATEDDFEKFVRGLGDMAAFKALANADPLTAMDAGGMLNRETTV
jgi:hypothetical protein